MGLEDSETTSDPLALFCARLKRLQMASGVSQSSLADAVRLGRSQMSDILNGKIKKIPDWDVSIGVVRACLKHAGSKGKPVPLDLRDEGDWRRRYADVEHDVNAGVRSRPRGEVQPGWLLSGVTDPFALEVHRPVQLETSQHGLPALPAYLRREHDVKLEQVIAAATQGCSGIAVLVGGSSTGKTRACWEALELLRKRPEPWRLWHPIDPSRPEAALRELPLIGPRTVIWLNEAQFYLDPPVGGLGERIAAGLRELLRDRSRAPVVVLATLWPQFWDALTGRPRAGEADVHPQARELLSARSISVPAAFTAAQLQQPGVAADPRLALAADSAEDGQVVQFLAGAPELMARYQNAPPAAAALLNAAIDGRRLGIGIALPLTFLEAATPGYLTDADWDGLDEDWLEQALTYAAAPCKGIRGPLTRIRPRTANAAVQATGPTYRLADYLEHHGRHARGLHVPPPESWRAAAHSAVTFPEQSNSPDWWHRYHDVLPCWFQTYVAMEEAAWSIRAYEPQLIPGLLQIEEYSAVVISLGGFPIEQAERYAALKQERQNRFRNGDLKLWVILDEAALHCPVAGPKVQLEQLRYLRTACGYPALTLQVLPYGAVSLSPPTGFSILRFPQKDLPDVIYVENLASALCTDDQTDVEGYIATMECLSVIAHDPYETLKLLDTIIADLETAQGA